MATHINRRAILSAGTVAIAASVAATTAAIGAAREPVELPHESERQLATLLADLDKAIADHAGAVEAEEWKVAEYRHLWPLAPEEVLGVANAWEHDGSRKTAETDLAGKPIYRTVAELTKRYSRQERAGENGTRKLNFTVERPDELRKRYASWRTVRPKEPKYRQKERARILPRLELQIRLSDEYHAETARLREVSGIADILAARSAARKRIETVMEDLSAVRATTPLGAAMKANAIHKWKGALGSDNEVMNVIVAREWSHSIVTDLLAMSLGEA